MRNRSQSLHQLGSQHEKYITGSCVHPNCWSTASAVCRVYVSNMKESKVCRFNGHIYSCMYNVKNSELRDVRCQCMCTMDCTESLRYNAIVYPFASCSRMRMRDLGSTSLFSSLTRGRVAHCSCHYRRCRGTLQQCWTLFKFA